MRKLISYAVAADRARQGLCYCCGISKVCPVEGNSHQLCADCVPLAENPGIGLWWPGLDRELFAKRQKSGYCGQCGITPQPKTKHSVCPKCVAINRNALEGNG